jgi:predicted CoA-binding protein
MSDVRTWEGPSARERQEILTRTRTVAIVGASDNPARASYFVATYLLSTSPYEIWFVNPRPTRSSAGRSTRPRGPARTPDLVDVFRRHSDSRSAGRGVAARARRSGCSSGSGDEDVAAAGRPG